MRNFKDHLGQHMTPERIATLLCDQIPGDIDTAIDFAVGDGALLKALRSRWENISLYGVDCDRDRVKSARNESGDFHISLGDGLTKQLNFPCIEKAVRPLFAGNPPFISMVANEVDIRLQKDAFPDVKSKQGLRRKEFSFLARSLLEAKKHGGIVAMIMPSAISSGIPYAAYRASLQKNFRVLKVIEIIDGGFRETEATTALIIIDTACGLSDGNIQISQFFTNENRLHHVYDGPVAPEQRWDARYWSAMSLHTSKLPTLGELGVDIARGKKSKAAALRDKQKVLHTTDLCRLSGHSIRLPDHLLVNSADCLETIVEVGDILLPRTGTRVRWEPIEVTRGKAVISDHVLRIRAPRKYRDAIKASFRHQDFSRWLSSISKGVCATVITKQELMQMPMFAMEL